MKYTNLENTFEKIGEEIKKKWQEGLKEKNKIASGSLFNSIKWKIIEDSNNEPLLQLFANDYWINIEKGRKPDSKLPPYDKIKEWVILKGFPNPDRTAFIIQRSIGARGIKAVPIVKPIIESSTLKWQKLMEKALAKDVKDYIKQKIKSNKNGSTK